jgi:predicted RNase H-like HicB family nuclease
MKLKYPLAVEPGGENVWCYRPRSSSLFSASDTLENAIENSKEAIALWIETVLDDGIKVPVPSHNSGSM